MTKKITLKEQSFERMVYFGIRYFVEEVEQNTDGLIITISKNFLHYCSTMPFL